MMNTYQQNLLVCMAPLFRFWGYHLQVMNAPPIFQKPHHKLLLAFPQGLPCLCVCDICVAVCVCMQG